MIKFFRKIRQQLLTENKFSKYLLYAIGEIILVIIGILIALNINNNNELKKNEDKFIYILAQVQKELEANINNTTKGILSYQKRDSLFGSVMSDTLEIGDFKTSDGYYLGNILFNGFESVILNNNLLKVNVSSNGLDERFNPIILKLDSLNLINEKKLLAWDKRIIDLRWEYEAEFSKTQPWFYNFLWNDNITDEGINHFLTNPFYKNQIAEYYKLSRNHLKVIQRYRIKAIECYKAINDLLNLSVKVDLDSLGYTIKKNTLKCYVGDYKFGNGDATKIILEDNKLMQLTIQGQDSMRSELYSISPTKFFTIDENLNIEFEKNKNCEVQFLIWKMLGGEYKFTKQ
jgi:hypothetical protein